MEYLRQDDWHELCTEDPGLAVQALCELARDGLWPSDRWNSALQLWSDQRFAEDSWKGLSPCLLRTPKEVLPELGRNAARWLRTVTNAVQGSHDSFLELCERILRMDYPSTKGDGDPFTQAINHPIGDVTEALLQWWFQTGLQDGQGLLPDLKRVFSDLCDVKIAEYRHARVWLAARAIALFRVDPDWTTGELVPLFEWAKDPNEATGVWSGFLQSARFYGPFLEEIKDPFLSTVHHYESLGDRGSLYAGLLVFAALDESGPFSKEELRIATDTLPDDGLQHSARLLAQLLGREGKDQGVYWQARVKPYLHSIWPQSNKPHENLVYARLAEVFIAAGDKFPDAMDAFNHWLKPLGEYGYVVTYLEEAGHCSSSPEHALRFLHLVVDQEQSWAPTELGECLNQIKAADSKLREDWRFVQLNEHWHTSGHY